MNGRWACYSSSFLSTLCFTPVEPLYLLFHASSFTLFLLYSSLLAQSQCHKQSSKHRQLHMNQSIIFKSAKHVFWISKNCFFRCYPVGLCIACQRKRHKGDAERNNKYKPFVLSSRPLSPGPVASSFAAPLVS